MIFKKLLGHEETEDMFLEYHFYSDKEIEEMFPEGPKWIMPDNDRNSWSGNNTPMPIDEAIKILQDMKEKGANYIEIDFHSDHVSYLFSGWEIRLATEEEATAETDAETSREMKKKEEKIKDLQKQLRDLGHEV